MVSSCETIPIADVPAPCVRQSRKHDHKDDRESGVCRYDAVEVISHAFQRKEDGKVNIRQATIGGEGTITQLADGQVFRTLVLE